MLCRSLCGGLRGGLRAMAGRRTPVPAAALQARHMSFGVPTSGPNLAFMVLGGGSLTAALFYVYKTVHSDSVRYSNRITDMETRLKTPADESASTAEVMTVNAVAQAVETVEFATEAASEEASDPGPHVLVDAAIAEEPAAETVAAIATEPPPEVTEAAEDLVSVAMEAAEATVAPVLEVLDAVKVLSSSVAEMAAASVGDESSSAAIVPPIGRAEERTVVFAEEVKLEQAYEDFGTSTKEGGGPEVPHCHHHHAELETSTMPPAELEDTLHPEHVENEYSITPPTGLEGEFLPEHADPEPETTTFLNAGLENTSYTGNMEPEDSTAPPAGLEDNTAQDDVLVDSTAALESVEETGAEDAEETTTRAM